MAEFDLIRRYFDWGAMPVSACLGVGDDAAILRVPPGKELVVSVDTLNSGVHFPGHTPPHAIGHKALAVNLSDLAAMGAEPAWFTLALSLPHDDEAWVGEFAAGMRQLAREHGIFLVGGDTTRGPLSVTVQAMGWNAPGQSLLRSGARHGDAICVSGTLGDAAAGLAVVQERLVMPEPSAQWCIQRLNYPTPRNVLAPLLRAHAHACMDISDGLLADLRHILMASGVGAHLHCGQLPLSPALRDLDKQKSLELALSGGDDYELLITLDPGYVNDFREKAMALGVPLSVVGRVDSGVRGIHADCRLPENWGYEHFSAN